MVQSRKRASVLTFPIVVAGMLILVTMELSYTSGCTVLTATFIPDLTQRVCGSHCINPSLSIMVWRPIECKGLFGTFPCDTIA